MFFRRHFLLIRSFVRLPTLSLKVVERLVRYVKENFIQGRTFINISDLNKQALEWCFYANSKISRDRDCIPMEVHKGEGCQMLTNDMKALLVYLAPLRSIDFEGFVNYEGRKFGVPFSYTQKKARVMRKGKSFMSLTQAHTRLLHLLMLTGARGRRPV